MTDIEKYFTSKVPSSWFVGPPRVEYDDDEILCIGPLAASTSVADFREDTRDKRMTIAQEAERRFRRKVAWGVEQGNETTVFTSLNIPMTTRLRLPERQVLDTLVDAGVARSRSDALSWCVRLVGRHQADWLADLREAVESVQQVRMEGPTLI